jgi:hypothetical protein
MEQQLTLVRGVVLAGSLAHHEGTEQGAAQHQWKSVAVRTEPAPGVIEIELGIARAQLDEGEIIGGDLLGQRRRAVLADADVGLRRAFVQRDPRCAGMAGDLLDGQIEQVLGLRDEGALLGKAAQCGFSAVLVAKEKPLDDGLDAPMHRAQCGTQPERHGQFQHQAGTVAERGALDQALE